MSDARLRELERRWRATGAVDDEAAWLAARVQAGELEPERLALAALLGHAAAMTAGAAEVPDPLAGRDEDAWSRVEAYCRASGSGRDIAPAEEAALRALRDDPARRGPCGHDEPWLHRLFDVLGGATSTIDDVVDDSLRVLRCWRCAERILVVTVRREAASRGHGVPRGLRGLALLDSLALEPEDDRDRRLADAVAGRRWAWGLGLAPLDVSVRAGIAASRAVLDSGLADPFTWQPVRGRPQEGARDLLARLEAWALLPDRAADLEDHDAPRTVDEATLDDDVYGVDLVASAITGFASGADAGDEVIAAARARRAVHGACRFLRDEDVRRAVRDEVAPWLLGLRGLLAR